MGGWVGGRRFVKQQQIRRLSSPTRTDLTSLINSEKDSERRISPYFCANMIQSASDSDIARLWLGCRSPLARHPSRSADQLQNTARLWTCAFRVPPSESRDAPGVGRSSNPPPPFSSAGGGGTLVGLGAAGGSRAGGGGGRDDAGVARVLAALSAAATRNRGSRRRQVTAGQV